MSSIITPKSLVGRLNPLCRSTLDEAVGLAMSRQNPAVEIEHWLVKLCDREGTDLHAILAAFDIQLGHFKADLQTVIDRFRTGDPRPTLSPKVLEYAREAFVIGSIEFGEPLVRSGHLLLAMLTHEEMRGVAQFSSPQLDRIDPQRLAQEFADIVAESREQEQSDQAIAATRPSGGDGQPPGPRGSGKTEALDKFTVDLTAEAGSGSMDPIIGRDAEIRQCIDILLRRRQNNPVLVGEAGVGKTAVVEGFAQRVVTGDVPPSLRNVEVRSLDLGLLQAGANVRGEFENRLRQVMEEVQASPTPIILFIDEAHMLIGAGGQAGQADAANLLKPALARGQLRTIAATTWAEYKKYFETDAALTRRFQTVKVDEPSHENAIAMMRAISPTLERHHRVEILEEAIRDSVTLSARYIVGRQLPDKSVSLLDTACARVSLSLEATPHRLETAERRIDRLDERIAALTREANVGADNADDLAAAQSDREAAQAEWDDLNTRWEREREIASQVRTLRDALTGRGETNGTMGGTIDGEAEGDDAPAADPAEQQERLQTLQGQLDELQGEQPMVRPTVDGSVVAEVIAGWTGIPAGRMQANEVESVLRLDETLGSRIVGQDHAVETLARTVRTGRAKLQDPRRPLGVFLFVGPSGVGKTETAISLAELLYGGRQSLTVINMSEFKEEHKVSMLTGAPPGYVGYGEGGVLTEAVRKRPYSVILFDELEKAHPGVQDVFYQVFDKGMLRDGEGRDIDFRNTLIVMTSNSATDLLMNLCADPDTRPEPEALRESLHEELLKDYKPAFLGRCTIVPYYPLDAEALSGIARLQIGRLADRLEENYGARLDWGDDALQTLVDRCGEVDSGARNIDRILSGTVLPELSSELLERLARGEATETVHVGFDEAKGEFVYTLS